MKKNCTVHFLLLVCFISNAQVQTKQEQLLNICRIYGLVKYYHSNANSCKINWDSISIKHIKLAKNATSKIEFNDRVRDWLVEAGPIEKAISVKPNIISSPHNNLNFDWTESNIFRAEVKDTLMRILDEFRPKDICHAMLNDYSNPSIIGWWAYPEDYKTIATRSAQSISTDSSEVKLLCLFRYWNRIHYLNPNNNILDIHWDTIFLNNVLELDTTSNRVSFYRTLLKFIKGVDDTHSYGLTYSSFDNFPYKSNYYPLMEIIYLPNKYVVKKSGYSSIRPGDILKSIDSVSMDSLEKKYSPYHSKSNTASFRRDFIRYITSGTNGQILKLTFEDSLGSEYSANIATTTNATSYNTFLAKDTKTKYKSLPCDMGYIHMGNLINLDVPAIMDSIWNKKTIIFDIRNYPQGTVSTIINRLFENKTHCITFPEPNAQYPGYFTDYKAIYGPTLNSNPYLGKIIILVNEQNQSHAEFTTMILQKFPRVRTFGSQTAGADGNINRFNITNDIYTGFSSIGVLYPDGTNAQKKGVKIDSIVYPSVAGIREGKDELLEYAMKYCGDFSIDTIKDTTKVTISVMEINNFNVFPTIAQNKLSIQLPINLSLDAEIFIYTLEGKLYNRILPKGKDTLEIDISHFRNSFYVLRLEDKKGSFPIKHFWKE